MSRDSSRFARFYKRTMIEDPWSRLPTSASRPKATQSVRSAQDLLRSGLESSIRSQVEFYFSPQNLDRDKYLRSLMDGNGWVPVTAVASFNRLKSITEDLNQIQEALRGSRHVQVNPEVTHVRPVGKVQRWVLPPEERSAPGRQPQR